MREKKLDVFLYGSCVSRDLQELWSHRFYRRAYVARQSIISATTPPYLYEGETGLRSAWQNRMVQGDLASDLLPRLIEDAPRTDLLIWDLTGERRGVQPLGDGSFGTISPDSTRSGILHAFADAGSPVHFGDPVHLELWTHALETFLTVLDAVGLRSRTFVLQPQWASLDDLGETIDLDGGLTSDEWAAAFSPYVEMIRAAGIPVISIPESAVRTRRDHIWGPAPFHYVDEAYAAWAREIEDRVLSLGGKRTVQDPLPEPAPAENVPQPEPVAD